MTLDEFKNIYSAELGRAAGAADIKAWGGSNRIASLSRDSVARTVRGSTEYQKKKNPQNYELANRDDYARDAKALKMYDLSVSIKGKAPTKGELNNWVRYGSLEEWESSLRDEIKWKNKRQADGSTVTIKYYSKEALDRLGGNLPKGTNAGEMIATPTSYGSVKGDRWTHGYEKDEWTYRSAMGSYHKGVTGKLFGERVEQKAAGIMPLLDPVGTVLGFGESGLAHRRKMLTNILGSEGRAKTFESGESAVEDAVAAIIDVWAFKGKPIVSSVRKGAKAAAAETLGERVNWGRVLGDVAVSWATYGATKGLDKYASSAGWGTNWTTYGRPLSQVAIGTAAGVARGQEFKDAFASSAVNVAAQQIIPTGADPWVAQAIKTGIPAAYQYSQAKGNDSAQMSAVASAIINYGAGVWQSSDQKTGELVTSPAAARAARKVTADEANKKLAAPPQASDKVRDVSDYFLAGGSTEERSRKLALYA